MAEPILMCWSGGKDSAMALYELQRSEQYTIVALLTTVTSGYDRISMHGVRRSLLAAQADALRLPLIEVTIPPQASNEIYEARMGEAFDEIRRQGIRKVAFGDIFLEDLRHYRERLLARHSLEVVFPIWHRDTRELVETFLALGFRAVTCCIDGRILDSSFAGRELDGGFLQRLPAAADPCGENGEFHTFVFDGPILNGRIGIRVGEIVARDERFYYCDLLPEGRPIEEPGHNAQSIQSMER